MNKIKNKTENNIEKLGQIGYKIAGVRLYFVEKFYYMKNPPITQLAE